MTSTTETGATSQKITKVTETWNDTQPGVKTRNVQLELACGHSTDGDRGTAYEIGTEIPCKPCTEEVRQKAKAAAERAEWLNHCNERIYRSGSFRGDWCSKKVKTIREVKIRTGYSDDEKIETVKKAYCSQHDPVRIAAKEAEERLQGQKDRENREASTKKAKDVATRLMTWLPDFGTIDATYRRPWPGERHASSYYTGGVELSGTQVEKLIGKLQRLQQLEAVVEKQFGGEDPLETQADLDALTEKCRHGETVPSGSVGKNDNRSDYCDECQAEMVERDRILRTNG